MLSRAILATQKRKTFVVIRIGEDKVTAALISVSCSLLQSICLVHGDEESRNQKRKGAPELGRPRVIVMLEVKPGVLFRALREVRHAGLGLIDQRLSFRDDVRSDFLVDRHIAEFRIFDNLFDLRGQTVTLFRP